MMPVKQKKRKIAGTSGITCINQTGPKVEFKPVFDSSVLDQQSLFNEAKRQCEPLTTSGTREANQAAKTVSKFTARNNGLKAETVKRMVTSDSELKNLTSGANAAGKVKEIVAAHDYNALHSGTDPRMVNAPKHISNNIDDVRISPDSGSKRDLLYKINKNNHIVFEPGGQVKTGSPEYIKNSLVEMANKPGYGKTGIIDSRFVNPGGSPRIAPDAFSESQAIQLRKAKVRLRGVKDLDRRGDALLKNLEKHDTDGLDPLGREQLKQLHNDIALAYKGKAVFSRVASSAAVGFATAAIISLVIQYSTKGQIEVKSLLESSSKAGGIGVAGTLADSGLYHVGIKLGMAPEAAKAFAQQGVTTSFCLLAIGVDVISEISLVKDGETSLADAVAGSSFKAAMDLLPLVLAPLGLAGVPILIGSQIGGRWVIERIRDAEMQIQEEITSNKHLISEMDQRIDMLNERCQESDELYSQLGLTKSSSLYLVK